MLEFILSETQKEEQQAHDFEKAPPPARIELLHYYYYL